MFVSGKTKVYGVIGDPIEHTLSPAMHNAAFEALKLDCIYLAFKVKPDEVENAVQGMRALDIQGLNVTMPYKNAVVSFLDEVDQTATFLSAVNTIENENGKLFGYNTDGFGALKALKENGVEVEGKKVLLLGAGGAARAIALALALEGADLAILNRNPKAAIDLANLLRETYNRKVDADELSRETVKTNLANAEVLVNATSVGMEPNVNQTLVDSEWLKPELAVLDIVYDPVETRLAKEAKAAGVKVVSGIEMLVHQGAVSFEIWTGHEAPVDIMREAALIHLRQVKRN